MIGTPESDRLCRFISKLTDGVTILAFSRGKDSLAAWLYLRNFFDNIIPIHCALVPGLSFVDRSLDYYENWFGVKIRRYLASRCFADGLAAYQFQQISDLDLIDTHKSNILDWTFEVRDVIRMVADSLDFPNYWGSMGYSMYDSLDRISWIGRIKGLHEKHRVFYPCWNWKPNQVKEYVSSFDISLPEDYLLTNRTIDSVPTERNLIKMKELYPEDYELCKLWFPVIEARIARQEFRKRHFQEQV